MEERQGSWHYGTELHESAEEKAQKLVKGALRRLGWKEADLVRHAKEDEKKVQIALQLLEQTVMTMEWIAQHLQMGTRTYLNHLLYWHRRGKNRNRSSECCQYYGPTLF